ncbi:MAG: tyrosine-type recombinase/integrase [Gammaproteobacteria bacterium]
MLPVRLPFGHDAQVFEGLTRNAVEPCWKRLCKRAKFDDLRLHDLRHESVSSLVEAGWNVIKAMAVSGHKDMRAFRRYAHPSTGHLVKKLDQLRGR